MRAADLLARALEAEGITRVFGYPGGAILPFYDALYDSPIEHILMRHEQAAVFAADAWARSTGTVGVCIATSGPGATNLITGLANAFMDSVPMLAITGQVPTDLLGSDAFQEVDVLGMTMPIVKHSYLVRDAADLPRIAREALHIARSGRPGPVLIDIPKDVLNAEVQPHPIEEPPFWAAPTPDPAEIEHARGLLRAAQRPLAYIGGGVFLGDATSELRAFLDATGIPAVTTLKGLGAVPSDHPAFLGMLGMHGLKSANIAVQECDLLICIGARFDDRVTGKLATFCPDAKVIHLDIDEAEVGKRRAPDAPVVGDLKQSLPALSIPTGIGEWRARCDFLRESHAWRYDAPGQSVYAPAFLRDLSLAARDRDVVVAADVGQHQMWVAQHWHLDDARDHLTSGGLGAMGFGLPAAIGAQMARPDARVFSVSGDGGFQMNLQELATVRRYDLPLKIVILDNSRLGMVRQWQELFLEQRYSETDLSDNPDFVRVAEAFGIPAFRVETRDDVAPAIRRLLDTPGPLLAHVLIDPQANVWPFVPPGAPNSSMLEGEHR